jgi:tRNA nucleotidyltransferase/poly(A) polymerase
VRIEDRVIDWLVQQEIDAYLVGGCVRDRLLGCAIYDLDLIVPRDSLRVARFLADHFRGAYYPLDEARGTGRAIVPAGDGGRLIVDVARFRGRSLADDLADRDFTINALAADVRAPAAVIDRCGGQADLQAGLIRPVSESSIRNDPLRALRAIRLAAKLGFALAPETERLVRRDGRALSGVAGERIRDEVARLLALPQAAPHLRRMDELGLLTAVSPELEPLRGVAQSPPHDVDVLTHSLETVQALEALLARLPAPLLPLAGRLQAHLAQILSDARPRLVSLKLAALLHDTGKPAARSVDDEGHIHFIGHPAEGAKIAACVLRRLRFHNAEVRLAETIVRHHMRPLFLAKNNSVSSRAVYRFFRATGDAGAEVLLHALADHRATYAPGAEDVQGPRLVALAARMLDDYWERREERVAPPPLLDGNDLIREFRLRPGPRIGELLEAVREAQVSGQVRTRAGALALVREELARD